MCPLVDDLVVVENLTALGFGAQPRQTEPNQARNGKAPLRGSNLFRLEALQLGPGVPQLVNEKQAIDQKCI